MPAWNCSYARTGQLAATRATPLIPTALCASLAIAAGANVKVLQTLLGHETTTLTLEV
jgi:site-specific recombinase XerD